MTPLPQCLADDLPDADRDSAFLWWSGLPAAGRDELLDLCHPARDGWMGLAPVGVVAVPVIRGGRFVPQRGDAGVAEWSADWREYLQANPELKLVDQIVRHTFHICTAHAEARRVIAAGRIPADFACPFADAACPMRAILDAAGGADLELRGVRGVA